MSEAFNSVIVDAKDKPIITMLEEIRAYAVKLDITGTIVHISLWMSRLQHLLRLHQMPNC